MLAQSTTITASTTTHPPTHPPMLIGRQICNASAHSLQLRPHLPAFPLLHPPSWTRTRAGKLTGRQIRNASAVCNRGLIFQTTAWRHLNLHVAVLKQARGCMSAFAAAGHARVAGWSAGGSAYEPGRCPAAEMGQGPASLQTPLIVLMHSCVQVHRQSDREFVPALHPLVHPTLL